MSSDRVSGPSWCLSLMKKVGVATTPMRRASLDSVCTSSTWRWLWKHSAKADRLSPARCARRLSSLPLNSVSAPSTAVRSTWNSSSRSSQYLCCSCAHSTACAARSESFSRNATGWLSTRTQPLATNSSSSGIIVFLCASWQCGQKKSVNSTTWRMLSCGPSARPSLTSSPSKKCTPASGRSTTARVGRWPSGGLKSCATSGSPSINRM
mmetsp:Transcript_31288/g.79064  ORF Transcript_31288/g.79064 Transcript_31288/m.79064 type:complete len:209 (+) Transcript_31288:224-850(+)